MKSLMGCHNTSEFRLHSRMDLTRRSSGRSTSNYLSAMRLLPRPEISTVWVAVATALVLGLAGCATEPGSKPEAAPYVGVFTGEFVDGMPLYRFPPILVIGSRNKVEPDI